MAIILECNTYIYVIRNLFTDMYIRPCKMSCTLHSFVKQYVISGSMYLSVIYIDR